MQIQHNFSLKPYNTFGINALASQFVEIQTLPQLTEVLQQNKDKKLFILGGGSNMLLTQDIKALVLHIAIKGVQVIDQNDDYVYIQANAGENWHQFVQHTINNNYGGLENMSLIPGNVGTTPIQNIGAYGTEIKDTFVSCTAMHIATQQTKIFTNQDCQFGYRESIFKNQIKDQYIITSVLFKLTKRNHKINISYGDITAQLAQNHIQNPTLAQISNAIIAIRQSKLPDPKILGNSGSFFKNPILNKTDFLKIQAKHPSIKFYDLSATQVKVPAGWLIEQAGYKGKRIGDAGVHQNQALVLVNYGNATGQDIINLAQQIQQAVLDQFGIIIEPEVNII